MLQLGNCDADDVDDLFLVPRLLISQAQQPLMRVREARRVMSRWIERDDVDRLETRAIDVLPRSDEFLERLFAAGRRLMEVAGPPSGVRLLQERAAASLILRCTALHFEAERAQNDLRDLDHRDRGSVVDHARHEHLAILAGEAREEAELRRFSAGDEIAPDVTGRREGLTLRDAVEKTLKQAAA